MTDHPEPDTVPAEQLPLDLDGTRAWLTDWLAEWGLPADALTDAEIRQIFRVSGGERERVERLAAQKFRDPAQLGPRREKSMRRPRLLALATFVLIAFLTWVFVSPPRTRTVQEVHLQLPPAPVAKVTPPVYVETSAQQAKAPAQSQPASPPPQAPPPAVPPPPPQSAAIPGLRPADWLATADGSRYVLQLIGARDPRTLRRFVDQAGIPARKLTLVSTRQHGQPWYVIVYGLYQSRQAARDDIGRLTTYAQRLKPWPRTVSELRSH